MTAPLDGIRVVESASFVSGPFVGQMLADLGAEVIKIEAPIDGDPFRNFGRPAGPYSAVFANCNRGKKSVGLDMKDPEARLQLLELIDTADVWITNWRPGVSERLGLADSVLAARNPRLVRLYISGFGDSGPEASLPAFDTIIQARSALSSAISHDGVPTLVPGFPVDKVTAAMATQSLLAALYARERRNCGERVDISMLAAAAYFNFVELFANRTFVDEPSAEARNLQAIGLRPLHAKDGWIVVAPVSGASIKALCVAVGHPEWLDGLKQQADQSRVASSLFSLLEPIVETRSVSDWLDLLQASDVPAARCLDIDDHLEDRQVTHQDLYRIEMWEGVGAVRTVRYPASFNTARRLCAAGPAPTVGQDSSILLGSRVDTDATRMA